ncbi:MAG TPA: C45 family peptidase [Bryobacteraceae bacterium]|nr:C45 family peptidase [Bryobacteraceae bacterium]
MTRRTFLASAAVRPGARQGTHHVYDFRGSPFEVGLQHGRALSHEIRTEADPAVSNLANKAGTTTQAALAGFRSKYEGIFREHLANVLEEIHGIAEGAKLPYDYAFFAATRDMTRSGACTALYAGKQQTKDGEVLIGQAKDTAAPLDRFRVMRISYASGRRMIILNYPGWIGNLAMTSDGLAYTGNSLYATDPGSSTVPGSLLKRLIMEKKSVGEVLDAARGMRFENGCLMVADASGRAACIELVAGRTEVRDISAQAFGHTNEILTPSLQRFERGEGRSASSPLRQRNVNRLLAEQAHPITPESMQQILRDHTDYPLSICRHPDPRDVDTTNAAFVADLKRREMHIAIGNPCVAPFKRYDLPG